MSDHWDFSWNVIFYWFPLWYNCAHWRIFFTNHCYRAGRIPLEVVYDKFSIYSIKYFLRFYLYCHQYINNKFLYGPRDEFDSITPQQTTKNRAANINRSNLNLDLTLCFRTDQMAVLESWWQYSLEWLMPQTSVAVTLSKE